MIVYVLILGFMFFFYLVASPILMNTPGVLLYKNDDVVMDLVVWRERRETREDRREKRERKTMAKI